MLFNHTFDVHGYEEYLKEKHNLAESSLYLYVKYVEQFLVEGNDPENLEHYNRFIIKHGVKSRATQVYSILKAFIKYKIDDISARTILIDNLVKPVIPTTSKVERQYLTEKQIINVINNLRHKRHKIIALIQTLTGVRAGDVLNIKRGDIIPEIYEQKAVLRIIMTGKGDKRNVAYIHDEIIQMLIIDFIVKNYYDDYYFMDAIRKTKSIKFWNYHNKRANYDKYRRDLKQALYAVGIDMKSFATHDYRRCYARRVWTRYKDLHVLQELLNHANPATTMRYLKDSGLQNVEYHKQMQS